MAQPTPLESLRKAVDTYGGQSATARRRGVSQAAVWKWYHGKVELPGEQVLSIEAETGVSKHDLRPDLYPREGAAPAAQDRPSDMVPAQ